MLWVNYGGIPQIATTKNLETLFVGVLKIKRLHIQDMKKKKNCVNDTINNVRWLLLIVGISFK